MLRSPSRPTAGESRVGNLDTFEYIHLFLTYPQLLNDAGQLIAAS